MREREGGYDGGCCVKDRRSGEREGAWYTKR